MTNNKATRATRPSDEQARHVHVLPQCDTARSVTGDSVGLEVAGDGQGSEVVTHSQVDLTIAAELAEETDHSIKRLPSVDPDAFRDEVEHLTRDLQVLTTLLQCYLCDISG